MRGEKLSEDCGVGNSALSNIKINAERNLKFVSDISNEDGRSAHKKMTWSDVENTE